MTGIEWIVDARDADPSRLRDRAALTRLLDAIVLELELRVVGEPLWHSFPGAAGVTGMYLLSESHLTIHTFPEFGSLCLNLFCCRAREEWDFERGVRSHTGAGSVRVRRVERAYADADVAAPPTSLSYMVAQPV